MTDPASANAAAIAAGQHLAREVTTWRRLCQDGVRALMAQHTQEDGMAVNPNAVLAQDLLYITVERELVTTLRGHSIDMLARFQRMNRDLVPRLLLGNESDETLLPALHSYHHFFDAAPGLEQLVIHRHAALDGHCTDGDHINATFDNDGAAQVRRFRRLLLTRKRLFLDELLVAWQAGFDSAGSHDRALRHWAASPLQGGLGGLGEEVLQAPPTWLSRIRRFVSDHMDYDRDWMRDTFRRAHTSVPLALKAPAAVDSTLSRYREAVKNMKGIDADLERLLKKAGRFERLSLDQLDKFNELHAERLVNQQIADVSAKQMPLLSTIGKNITDFKVGDAALQALLLIGQSSALAALDGMKQGMSGYSHRVDWTEIGNEALIDLAQVGGMVAVTLLFGPAAGAGAAGLIGLLFRGKAPDLHEERFKALDKKLDRVLDRISALEEAVMARLNAIPGQVRNVVVEERFRAAVAALSDQFSNIQRRHEELFTGRRRHLYGVDLHAEVQGMRDNLQSLVRALWCDGFSLNPLLIAEQAQIRGEEDGTIPSIPRRFGEVAPPKPVVLRPTASSVIVTLTRGANHEGHAQRFEHTIEAIHALAQLVAELGSAYSRAVEHILSTLGASLVLPGPTPPAAALVQARDLERLVDEDLQVLLWVGAELWRAPGKRNLALYERLAPCREDWKNLDPFRGFLLLGVDTRGHWSYDVEAGGEADPSHVVRWGKQDQDARRQLFIVPDGGSADKAYTFVNAVSQRQTATARLALGLDDTLTLHTGKHSVRVTYDAIGADRYEQTSVNWAVQHGYNESTGSPGNTIGMRVTRRLALAAPDSWLALVLNKTTGRASVEVQIDVRKNSDDTPLRTIPLLSVSLTDARVSAAYQAGTLRWVIGRTDTGRGPVGPVFVGVGVLEPADDKHPTAWTRLVEVYSLNPARAVNLVQSEAAYDIPVEFKVDDRPVVVLFDNLTAFLPKDYLLRGQSLPAGGYLMDARGVLTLVAQRDRHLVMYRETSGDKESVEWSSGVWQSKATDGGPLTLTPEGALEQKDNGSKLLWSAAQYDVKRGKSWKLYQKGEATRLVLDSYRARMLNARGQDCFVFHSDEIKSVKKISELS